MSVDTVPRVLAALYGVLGLTFTVLLGVVLPPLQGADEGAHYARADQISRGEILAYRPGPDVAGGTIDLGIIEAVRRFYPIVQSEALRSTHALNAPQAWGRPGLWGFANTAVYPPFFYLPASAAILVGKASGLDVLQTATLARLSLTLTSVGVASLAIALAGPAAIWFFALMLLPSSASLMATLTQDGPMLATAALVASLMLRLQTPSPFWRLPLAGICVGTALLGMSRPPYVAFAILPLATSGPPIRSRWIAASLSVAATVTWCLLCARHIMVQVDPTRRASIGAQIRFVCHHPLQLGSILATTLHDHFRIDYAGYFITPYGHPGPYTVVAYLSLLLALLGACAAGLHVARPRSLIVAASTLAAIVGVFAIQYLTWTAVGGASIEGVLGRYFLPMAAIAIVGLVAPPTLKRATWPISPAVLFPVVLFPIVSIACTVCQIVERYYMS